MRADGARPRGSRSAATARRRARRDRAATGGLNASEAGEADADGGGVLEGLQRPRSPRRPAGADAVHQGGAVEMAYGHGHGVGGGCRLRGFGHGTLAVPPGLRMDYGPGVLDRRESEPRVGPSTRGGARCTAEASNGLVDPPGKSGGERIGRDAALAHPLATGVRVGALGDGRRAGRIARMELSGGRLSMARLLDRWLSAAGPSPQLLAAFDEYC